jgi:hypothetical protein
MIDREARAQLARDLMRVAAGHITSDELEERFFSLATSDRAVKEIGGLWSMDLSDLHARRFRGKDALPKKTKHELARSILFLKTELEYEWPSYGLAEVVNRLLGLASHGVWTALLALVRRFESRPTLDKSAWPFRTTDELDRARSFTCGVVERGLA